MIQHNYPLSASLPISGRSVQSQQQAATTLSVQAVLSTLANLTRQQAFGHGWLLLIAPPWQLTKNMLEQAGINSQRILLIPQKQISRFDNLMRDALTCSTCSAVVSFLSEDQIELEDYRYLSAKYGTPLLNMTTDLLPASGMAH